MSSGSFECRSDLVFTFIFGFIVRHYLDEIKILFWRFVGLILKCRSRMGLRQIELIVGLSNWKRKGFGISIPFGSRLQHSALESQVGCNTLESGSHRRLQLLRKAIWSSIEMKSEFEGGVNHYLNVNSDRFQLISKQHLEFGSAPFSNDCA